MHVIPTNFAEIIFELGRIQCFHYPKIEDIGKGLLPKDVFWQDIFTKNTYGPFPCIYEAMRHYTILVSQQNIQRPAGQVIHVDFMQKKKVLFDMP